jgi:D-hydroxyproline dehydrogenase subunit alpha
VSETRRETAQRLGADIVIVGAGPAGIAAATRAAGAGKSVLVLDEGMREGGQIWRHRVPEQLPGAARSRIAGFRDAGIQLRSGVSVVGSPRAGELLAEDREGEVLLVEWRDALILAVGGRERFLPFPGWTLPGVVGVGGGQALLKAGIRVDGWKSVVAGSGPLLLPVAALLAKSGAPPEVVAEQAPQGRVAGFTLGLWRSPGKLLEGLKYRAAFRSAPYRFGWWVTSARGDGRVEEVTLTNGTKERTYPCNFLCVSYGLVPATELPRGLGCETTPTGVVAVDEWQRTSVPGVFCAGETTGVAGVESSLVEGAVAGLAAAGREAEARKLFGARDKQRAFGERLDNTFRLREEVKHLASPSTPVCRCEDVTMERLQACASIREAKVLTRAGMGPCQGRVCGPALSALFGWDLDRIRPPVIPMRAGSLAALDPDAD